MCAISSMPFEPRKWTMKESSCFAKKDGFTGEESAPYMEINVFGSSAGDGFSPSLAPTAEAVSGWTDSDEQAVSDLLGRTMPANLQSKWKM